MNMLEPWHLVVLITAGLVIPPFWQLFKRAGFHPAVSLLMIVPIVNFALLYLLAFGNSHTRVVSAEKSSEAGKPKREGLHRLSIAIAVFATVLSSFLIGGSLIPQSNSPVVLLPVLFFSVIIGAVCWALVRLVVWTIDGFRSQKVKVPEDLDK